MIISQNASPELIIPAFGLALIYLPPHLTQKRLECRFWLIVEDISIARASPIG